VSALGQPAVVDQLGIGLLRPAPRSRIEFVREDAHGNRDGDVFGIEYPLPQYSSRDGRPEITVFVSQVE